VKNKPYTLLSLNLLADKAIRNNTLACVPNEVNKIISVYEAAVLVLLIT
jgi:hypothetical protein